MEWRAFLDDYDTMAAANEADRNPGQLDSRYDLYQVYKREMANKLDEIVEKYGLKLHTKIMDAYEHPEVIEEFREALGDNQAYSAYLFEDGTLHFDGEYYLPNYGKVDYQFSRYVRGTINTACNQTMTLDLGLAKALLLADLGDSFVTLNVLTGMDTDPGDIFPFGPLSVENLEALADSFDFTGLILAVPPDTNDAEIPEPGWISPAEDMFCLSTGIQESVAQDFYCEFVRAIDENRRLAVAELIAWPRTVFAQEGSALMETAEDFLPYYDAIFTEGLLDAVHENQYDQERVDLITHDGMIGGASGAIWFALTEDGHIAVLTVQNPEGNSVRYNGPAGVQKVENDRYVGQYNDDVGKPNLVIQKQEDETYAIQIGIFRSAYLDDGVGELMENGIVFSATTLNGGELTGTITLEGDIATVTFTNAA